MTFYMLMIDVNSLVAAGINMEGIIAINKLGHCVFSKIIIIIIIIIIVIIINITIIITITIIMKTIKIIRSNK